MMYNEDVGTASQTGGHQEQTTPPGGLVRMGRISPSVLALHQPESPRVEALRRLLARLLLWREGGKLKPLAIVSVDAEEGRSFIAANLAVLFAQSGKRTLLIDADLRTGGVHDMFGCPPAPGLSELLLGETDWGSIQSSDTVPGLFLLPAGVRGRNPLELLASERLNAAFEQLQQVCDVVLLDTPATSEQVDAEVIAAKAGTALLVVRRDHTRVQEARKLSDALKAAGVAVVGTVINQH